MGSLSKSRNLWFMLLIVPLVMVMLYMNVVAPLKEERQAAEQELHRKQAELEAIKTKLDANAAFGGPNKVMLDQVRTGIPEAPYTEELIRHFRMLEVVSGLQMESYNIQAADTAAPGEAAAGQPQPPAWSMLALPVKMSTVVKGDYLRLHRMLSELPTVSRIIQVESLSFTAPAGYPVKLNAYGQEVSGTITFVAYYAPGLGKFYSIPVPTEHAQPPGRINPIY